MQKCSSSQLTMLSKRKDELNLAVQFVLIGLLCEYNGASALAVGLWEPSTAYLTVYLYRLRGLDLKTQLIHLHNLPLLFLTIFSWRLLLTQAPVIRTHVRIKRCATACPAISTAPVPRITRARPVKTARTTARPPNAKVLPPTKTGLLRKI